MSLVPLFNEVLGEEIRDVDEETFILFSSFEAVQGLGMYDGTASTLELSVAGHDMSIQQSPTILKSSRALGTTGAVVWKVSPLFAEWLASPTNFLGMHGIMRADSTILELGCGVSGILALVLARRVARYIATDQAYVLKLLQQNLDTNRRPSAAAAAAAAAGTSSNIQQGSRSRTSVPVEEDDDYHHHHHHQQHLKNRRNRQQHRPRQRQPAQNHLPYSTTASTSSSSSSSSSSRGSNIQLLELDWETSSLSELPSLLIDVAAAAAASSLDREGVNDKKNTSHWPEIDLIVICDCIFNEALIDPLVDTCAEMCRIAVGDTTNTINITTTTGGGACGAGGANAAQVTNNSGHSSNNNNSSLITRERESVCIFAQQLRVPCVFETWLEAMKSRHFHVWRVPDALLTHQLRSDSGFAVHLALLER